MSVDLNKLYVRNIELNNETELSMYQSEVGDVGCVVWDAALVLAKYLETEDFKKGKKLVDKVVLELGAGTGAVGLVAAALGSKSIITDLPQFVPLMSHNITANSRLLQGNCTAMPLTWGSETDITAVKQTHYPNGIDYIIVADCVYYEESIDPLMATICAMSCDKTVVLCSYEDRELGDKQKLQESFFKTAKEHFEVEEIPSSSQDPCFTSPDIHVIKMTVKTQAKT